LFCIKIATQILWLPKAALIVTVLKDWRTSLSFAISYMVGWGVIKEEPMKVKKKILLHLDF
jgi:hypothetical protein